MNAVVAEPYRGTMIITLETYVASRTITGQENLQQRETKPNKEQRQPQKQPYIIGEEGSLGASQPAQHGSGTLDSNLSLSFQFPTHSNTYTYADLRFLSVFFFVEAEPRLPLPPAAQPPSRARARARQEHLQER